MLVPLEHKAAGHDSAMQSEDGELFVKPTKQQEMDFYNETERRYSKLKDPNLGSALKDWMPRYLGVLTPQSEGGDSCIVLENTLNGFSKPAVLDVKLGSVLYDENAAASKVERMKQVSKDTTSGSLKMRVCGLQIVDAGEEIPAVPGIDMAKVTSKTPPGYVTFDKWFGRGLTDATIVQGLSIYFRQSGLSKPIQGLLLDRFILRLQMLYNCLLDCEIRVISGSVLFAYEGDETRWKERNNEEDLIFEKEISEDDEEGEDGSKEAKQEAPLSYLKMIDFAHAKYTDGEGHDEEVVGGIESLINALQRVRDAC